LQHEEEEARRIKQFRARPYDASRYRETPPPLLSQNGARTPGARTSLGGGSARGSNNRRNELESRFGGAQTHQARVSSARAQREVGHAAVKHRAVHVLA
jgi:hypothetical protein